VQIIYQSSSHFLACMEVQEKAVLQHNSVSEKFRQLLTDLIKTKHNSNRKTKQTTLTGRIIQNSPIVPADVVHLKKDIWFSKLDNNQTAAVEKFLETRNLQNIE
jgi:hypothetical protein